MQGKISSVPKKVLEQFGGYWVGENMTASPSIIELTDHYKLNILKQMISLYPNDVSLQNPKRKRFGNDLVITLKRDGMYNVLYYDNRTIPRSIFCNSPYGRARYNLPVNQQIENELNSLNSYEIFQDLNTLLSKLNRAEVFWSKNQIYSMVIAGEMFARIERKGDRPRIFDVMKLLWNPSCIEDLEKVSFDMFDLLSINEVSMQSLKYRDRLDLLSLLFPRNVEDKNRKIGVVQHLSGVKGLQVPQLFNQWVVQERNEGLVITNKYGLKFKLKTCYEVDVVVIGFALSRTKINDKENIGSLLVALIKPDGNYQILTSVKSGFTNKQRIDLLDLVKEDVVPSHYEALNHVGMPFRLVKPKYVLQMKFLDVITEDSFSKELPGVCLTFKKDHWYIENTLPFVKLINPWFDDFRSDIDPSLYPSLQPVNPKEPVYHNIKIDQIFPFFKRLSEGGALLSINIMKHLLMERITTGSREIIINLAREGYLCNKYFTQEEMQLISEKIKVLD